MTNDHDSHAEAWYDQLGIEPPNETALVTPAALQLVNNFLDQLLFNFLSISKSTTLSALRPAVTEVLKPKLAKDAINQADEELREYLGGGNDEGDSTSQGERSARDWDLELVWKRTRLRCMVYSSLGDMEEEDEDFYTEQEDLDVGMGEGQSGPVPAAVSIFLTSILEFMGEAALVIAGQAAYHRIRDKYAKQVKKGDRSPTDPVERIVVEDVDMERVALDRTLGRLWRAWKKKLRSPPPLPDNGSTRPYMRDHMRQASLTFHEAALPATVQEPETEAENQEAIAQEEPVEDYLLAARIPLPMRDNDVDEIEVPGLCSFSGDDDDENTESVGRIGSTQARPKSLMIFSFTVPSGLPTATSQPPTPVALSRKRSNSLPTPIVSLLLPSKRQKVEAIVDHATEGLDDANDSIEKQQTYTAEKPLGVAQEIESGTAQLSSLSGSQLATVSESPEEERAHKRNVSSTSVVIDTAAAVEVATVAGFKAQAEEEMDQDVTDIEEDDEEPQVFTSSRISMSGRSTSPTTSEPGKPTAASLRPVRTLSVHSLRLIEVTGPRSPSIRSRGSSVDATELMRSGNLSRANSVSTTPIVEEHRTAMEPQPATKASTSILSNESISEAEEYPAAGNGLPRDTQDVDLSATPVVKPRSPARFSQLESDVSSSQPIFGSARRKSPPASSPRSSPAAAANSANLITPRNGGTFFFDNDDKPEVPENSQYQSRVRTTGSVATQSPTVPARSPGRDALAGQQQRGLRIQTGSEATTIGVLSVQPQPHYQGQSHARNNSAMSASRQPHTSASSVSSANFINGNNTPGNRPNLKAAARSSEESVATSRADVERNFEELIQSDETIQYTLTPQSMRDDVRNPYSPPTPPFVTRQGLKLTQSSHAQPFNSTSPLVSVKSRKSEDVARTRERSRSTSVNRANKGIKRSPSGSGAAAPGLTSHHGPSAHGLHVNGPAVLPSAKGRSNEQQQLARDARMPRESLADFADFIRSTGPAGESVTPIVNVNGSNAFTRAAGNGGHPGHPIALPIRTTSSGMPSQLQQVAKASTNSNRTYPNPNIPRKQARDAVVDQREDNSDLIDFIRRGPPNAVDDNNTHRIPRTVAPFRTTMDSDQMSGAVGGKAVDAQIRDMGEVRASQASTTITDYSMPSVQSSANSSTGLLRNKNINMNGTVPSYGGASNEDMPMPKRKTRRVRDPYAIDLSDEEEEEEEEDRSLADVDTTPKASRRAQPQEESLADFLRNYAPPPEPVQAPVQPPTNRPKKKASAPSLMARFTRRNSTANSAAPGSPKMAPPPMPQSNRNLASRADSVSSAKTIGSQRHIPIHVNMPPGVDKYAVPKTMASGLGSRPPVSMNNGGGRVQMKRFEPREPVSVPTRTATSDLADFLRNSGPPAGALVQDTYQPAQSESRNGFFGRRKKSSLA